MDLCLNGWWIIVIRTGLIIINVNIQEEKITINSIYCCQRSVKWAFL